MPVLLSFASQGVVRGPIVPVWPGCLIEIQNLEPDPRPDKSASRFCQDPRRFQSLKCVNHGSKVLGCPLTLGGFSVPPLLHTVPSLLPPLSFPSVLSLILSSLPSLSGTTNKFFVSWQIGPLLWSLRVSHHLGPEGLTFYQLSILSSSLLKYLSKQGPQLRGTLIPDTLIKEISPSQYKTQPWFYQDIPEVKSENYWSLSHVWLLVTPWTAACQAPLSMHSPGKNTGVGNHFLFQGIFSTQGSRA